MRNLFLFNEISGISAKDCVETQEELIFLANERVEKSRIMVLEKIFKKKIRIIKEAQSIEEFVRNFYNGNVEVSFDGSKILILGNKKKIIGANGNNINILKLLLNKYFKVNKVIIRDNKR